MIYKTVMSGQPGQFIQYMAGDQHGDLPLPVQLQDQLSHLYDSLRIQAVSWLIQNQEIRIP